MAISADQLERLEDKPLEVCLEICKAFSNSSPAHTPAESCLEIVVFLRTILEAGLINYDGPIPDIEDGRASRAAALNFTKGVQDTIEAILKRENAISLQRSLELRFKQTIKGSFGYEFTDGDIQRVQKLIDELRGMLTADTTLEDGHKRRLLGRLEALQKELHKKISDLSNFYNLMGDAGVALGKLGKDAKPFVDRIKEIVNIGWKSQARAEQLPSSADNPMIGNDHSGGSIE